MGKKVISAVAALALGTSLMVQAAVPALAMGVDRSAQAKVQQSDNVEKVGCWWRNGRQFCNGGRGWGGGGAAAAGIFGLATGAIIGGAIVANQNAQANANAQAQANANAQQAENYQAWMNYCSSKYRSFDPQSGTYLSSDGTRRPCQ